VQHHCIYFTSRQEKYGFGEEIKEAADLLLSMLQYRPEDRITPAQALCHKWLADD